MQDASRVHAHGHGAGDPLRTGVVGMTRRGVVRSSWYYLQTTYTREISIMTDNLHPIVETVVKTFKSQLPEDVRDQITNAEYADLAIMIDEAIGTEIASIAEVVEELARKLRASARTRELGL